MTTQRGVVARFGVGLVAVALSATALTGCSGNGSSAHLPGSNPNQAVAGDVTTSVVATRWWSTPATTRGSVIDTVHPTDGAAHLRPSRADYCAVLQETVKAGRSVLGGASATDPAVLVATEAFVAETSALAPPRVSAAWKTFGGALVQIAASGGDLTRVKGVNPTAVRHAAIVIAADSTLLCHMSLSGAK